jgi:hypothetical protein
MCLKPIDAKEDVLVKSPLDPFRSWFDTCLCQGFGEPTTFVGRQASPRTENQRLTTHIIRSP